MGMYGRIREVAPGDLDCLAGPVQQAHELFRRNDPAGRVLSIEKAWDGLHYLLTGSDRGGAEPLGFIKRGGRPVGRDLGYGPARLLDADFVRRLDEALRGISGDELWGRFDAAQFAAAGVAGIYPGNI